MKLQLAGFTALLAFAGCSAPPAGRFAAPSAGARDVSSGTPLERYFPLVDGHLYHYATVNERGETGLLIARVHRESAVSGELRLPASARRFRYETEGVVGISRLGASTFVLKAPLAPGAAWTGEHGGTTTVTAVDAAVDVPAGHFEGCVVTVERTEGPTAVRYATTFCPDTGIVVLEVQSGSTRERAALQSYGAPVTIGAEGLQRVP